MANAGATSGPARHATLPDPLQRAVTAHQAGRLSEAYPLYRRFVDDNPTHPTALQLLGLLHSQRGEYESAIALMRESLRQFPEQAEVANNLGNALSASGRIDAAIESYADALRLKPDYPDALRNLGLCFLETGNTGDATKCFQRCLEIEPGNAVTWNCLGTAYRRGGNLDAAMSAYEKALDLRPDYAEAHHNLGVILRIRQCPRDAQVHYDKARQLGLDRAELYFNIGNARIDDRDVEGAIDAYRAAVERNPADLGSHRNLNSLLWQLERTDEYLQSYRDVLQRKSSLTAVRLAYAMALNQQNRCEEAEQVLLQGDVTGSSGLTSMLAYSLEGQGRWAEALRLHEAAVQMPDAVPNHRVSLARALLARGHPQEALQHAQQGVAQLPHDQRALAYLGLCWRMLQDAREPLLNDYDNLVQAFDVPVPAAYASRQEFNERLAAVLDSLHLGRRHPPEQTLRGGTQTSGELFLRREPEIVELVNGLRQCIDEYLGNLRVDAKHPMLSRRTERYDFAASWSVRLMTGGFHTMHVHPLGWISSAYYVQVPPAIIESDAHGGGLKFGEPDIDIGESGAPRRCIQPAVGRLVLFPSYMWHGTVPFDSGHSRLTVAFDVVPR